SSALRPGGALILAEKFRFEDPDTQALMTALHEDHKRANGYSELEIAGKRAALDNVLIADTRAEHVARLERAGFTGITLWQAQLNFGAFVAFRRD
ncbi:MAG: carboxy-S-adenosyl-L-methionine synthase CmoA, partial [Pseudomonadota bacterium]